MPKKDEQKLPLLTHPTEEPSVFLPENLLAQASTMKGGGRSKLPACCLLDFDGELVAVAQEHFGAQTVPDWPCFHTSLLVIEQDGFEMGLIGGTVGASFAVLVIRSVMGTKKTVVFVSLVIVMATLSGLIYGGLFG